MEQLIELIGHQFAQVDLDYGHGTDNAYDEAAWVVHFVLDLNYGADPEQYQQAVSREDFQHIQALAHERMRTRKPLAYLTKQMWFAGIEFFVDERVLVPRSPIAELIQAHFHPWLESGKIHSVLDLCTGSGCIGMAIAMHMPQTHVTCSDISAEALQVAAENREKLNLSERVVLLKSDMLEDIPQQKFDLIVSNPPYVDQQDMDALSLEFKHEPNLGLASGEDGLDHVRQILRDASDYLSEDGHVIIEVGNSMHALQDSFPHVPFMWLEFEHGGDGVFMLSAQQVKEFFN